jgi:hypothetical protein
VARIGIPYVPANRHRGRTVDICQSIDPGAAMEQNGDGEHMPGEVISFPPALGARPDDGPRLPGALPASVGPGGPDRGGAGSPDPLAALTRGFEAWGRAVEERGESVARNARDLAHGLDGVQRDVRGVKDQADGLVGRIDDAREQIRQTHELLVQHATHIDTVDVRAQDSAARIMRLEAALARTEKELAALRAADTALRSRAKWHAAWLVLVVIAVAALAWRVLWPMIAPIVG